MQKSRASPLHLCVNWFRKFEWYLVWIFWWVSEIVRSRDRCCILSLFYQGKKRNKYREWKGSCDEGRRWRGNRQTSLHSTIVSNRNDPWRAGLSKRWVRWRAYTTAYRVQKVWREPCWRWERERERNQRLNKSCVKTSFIAFVYGWGRGLLGKEK